MSSSPRKAKTTPLHPRAEVAGEVRISARAVSRGVAIGPVVVLSGLDAVPEKRALRKSESTGEIKRLKRAFSTARRELRRLSEHGGGKGPDSRRAIFDAHLAILEDPFFYSGISEKITAESVNVEWAVRAVAEFYAESLSGSADSHLRERADDIIDVAVRLVRALEHRVGKTIPSGAIVVAPDINPSAIVEFVRQGAAGICTEAGGWTSHSSIIAREADIPAVIGVRASLHRIKDGETVIVDGFRGEVILRPTAETLKGYEAINHAAPEGRNDGKRQKASETLDGVGIRVRLNLDPVGGLGELEQTGAEGVGLFRTEMLFEDAAGFPSEVKQRRTYEKVLGACGKWGAVVRTFDIQHDRVFRSVGEQESNPSLGVRGTRLMFELESEFRAQIRALLKAACKGRLSVLLPMISDVAEIRAVRKMMRDEARKLRAKGVAIGRPRLGAMVEIPSAVLIARQLFEEVDFVNLGTNDLVQYLLGVDRDNGNAAGYFRTLHPAVLHSVKKVLDEGTRAGKPVIVCGEMAGSPAYVGVLIGLGATDISVGARSIDKVRRVINGLAAEECREVVEKMLACSTATESENVWESEFGERLRALVPNLSFSKKNP